MNVWHFKWIGIRKGKNDLTFVIVSNWNAFCRNSIKTKGKVNQGQWKILLFDRWGNIWPFIHSYTKFHSVDFWVTVKWTESQNHSTLLTIFSSMTAVKWTFFVFQLKPILEHEWTFLKKRLILFQAIEVFLRKYIWGTF